MFDRWLSAGLRRGSAAVLASLHLGRPAAPALDDREWQRALSYADRSGLTLLLAGLPSLPAWVAARIAADHERNRERLRGLQELYGSVCTQLSAAEVPYVLLKGLPQCALSGLPPEQRVQYDIDLLTPRDRCAGAVAALAPLGFAPFSARGQMPIDHLPPLIRKTGWEFRGDYFDPAIPTSIEVHFQLWDEPLSRLAAPGIEAFWERRMIRDGLPQLAQADALAYACLHLLKHLLHGSVRPLHVYELACMLERQAANQPLWSDWREQHPAALRRLEVLGMQLAAEWFGCALPPAAAREWATLPAATRSWFDAFALAPAHANHKSELWLHCSLLGSTLDKAHVIRRRVLPLGAPLPVDAVYLTERGLTPRRRALRLVRQARFVAGRAAVHATAAFRLAGSGARWWWKRRALGA